MLGTAFTVLSTFLFLSLLTQTSADPGFGIVNSGPKITNWGGIYGAYISSIFTVFLGYSAYLIPAFLLINGLRMLLGIKNSNVLLKFFILLLGIMLLCLVLTLNEINGGLIGDFLLRLIGVYFIQHLDGSPLRIANADNAVEVVDILVQASQSLIEGVPIE